MRRRPIDPMGCEARQRSEVEAESAESPSYEQESATSWNQSRLRATKSSWRSPKPAKGARAGELGAVQRDAISLGSSAVLLEAQERLFSRSALARTNTRAT
jgi:hypothetical protein